MRDGAQGLGTSFSLRDKLKVLELLMELGLPYIEGGTPFSNPRDMDFFRSARAVCGGLVAFSTTKKPGNTCDNDPSMQALLNSGAKYAALVGKASAYQVKTVLRIGLDENIELIHDSISYLTAQGIKVFFDAEHAFDGYFDSAEYTLSVLKAAQEAGAVSCVLCDTNGGTLPMPLYGAVRAIAESGIANIGIHTHNDSGLAAANSLLAVQAGANIIQGTMCGLGERCGNADLCELIPTLELKLGYKVLPEGRLSTLTGTARRVAEIANISLRPGHPYVGQAAFSHKGGLHVDAILKERKTFEHIDPELVGNERRMLLSDQAGRSTLLDRLKRLEPNLERNDPRVEEAVKELKRLENEGYQFEGGEASFDLIAMKILDIERSPFFEILECRLTVDEPWLKGRPAIAVIKVKVGDRELLTCAEGDGPVDALNNSLKAALTPFYPVLNELKLMDFKVRVIDTNEGTAARVRVHIDSWNGKESIGTVGVAANIIEACYSALIDSIEITLIKGNLD